MKRNFLFISCLLAVLFSAGTTSASHIIGGEISYECLGKNTFGDANRYRIIMKIYRDCQGGGTGFDSALGVPFDASITIHRDIDSLFQVIELEDPPMVRRIEPSSDPCLQIPSNVCVEEGVYEFEVELAIINASYHIVYQRCCRNSTINNIIDPGRTGSTYTTEITAKAQEVCNSSPIFDNFPPIVICVGKELAFSAAASDIEGDSIFYEFCAPYTGGGPNSDTPFSPSGIAPNPEPAPPYQSVAFIEPTYTAEQPLSTTSRFSIDANSGLIEGMPTLLGQFVVAVCMYEYRNGELLSIIHRDFQLNVTECTSAVTAMIQADSVDISDNRYFFESCSADELNFINESIIRDNILSLLWRFDLGGDTLELESWDAAVNFPNSGQYLGQLILNPNTLCGDTANIVVDIYPELTADFDFNYDSCAIAPVQFQDASIFDSQQTVNWEWSFGDSISSNLQNPLHQYEMPAAYEVTLKIKDDNQCVNKITKALPYFPIPEEIVIDPSIFKGCTPQEIVFDNLSFPLSEEYMLSWDFGDGNSSSAISPVHTYESEGIYDISLGIQSPLGCEIEAFFEALIEIDAAPTAAFSYTPDQPDIRNPNISIRDESINAAEYEWLLNDFLIAQAPEPSFTFQDTGLQKITLIVTHESGCQDSSTALIDIAPDVFIYVPNAFAPEGNAGNRVFKGLGILPNISDYSMSIWDRWGNPIFESSDPEAGWTGDTSGNAAAPPGVYIYVIEFMGARGKRFQYAGSLTLVR
ncbi:MAG: PKD domain-containing protein [Bacteroidota bacterium]